MERNELPLNPRLSNVEKKTMMLVFSINRTDVKILQ